MKNANVLRRGCAWILSLALLVGMISVLDAFSIPTSARAQLYGNAAPQKFLANFSEVKTLLSDTPMNDGGDYALSYTPIGDTKTVDGKINAWMREKFVSKTNYVYSSTRAWIGQKSDEISDVEGSYSSTGGWGKNGRETFFRFAENGALRLKVQDVAGANMLRRVDTIIPQFDGTNVQLKNFKATIKYKTYLPDYRGAITVGFDETDAGYIVAEPNVYGELDYRRKVTGSTLVIGNGTGMERDAANDGWIFYDKKELISSTTVDNQYNADPAMEWKELKPDKDIGYTVAEGGVVYQRFDDASSDQEMTLTVEVRNGNAVFTLVRADGTVETMAKAYTPRGGFFSIGMSNRDYAISYVEIEEYDDAGDVVDFGTYHNSLFGVDKAVDVFEADFTDLPDVHYVNGQYLYNKNHDSQTGVNVGLTAMGTTNVTSVGAFTADGHYAIDVKDTALADYLESKFDFYVYANGAGNVVERWNAAGYFVDAQGNNLSNGYGSGKEPSTGVGDGAWMPGNGAQGVYYYQYPTMSLNGNRWLRLMPGWSLYWAEPFQIASYFKVKNSDGTDAVLKNFQLDLDFKLTTASATEYPQNQSPVFVKFGGYDGVVRESTDGAMFAISCGGGYFLDDLNTPVNGSTFMNTHAGNGAPYYTENVGVTVDQAHLTLTVKNGTVKAVVTAADGSEILNVTRDDINVQNGLIQIGTTYAGIYSGMPYFGAVKVTRLNEAGEPIDFEAEDDSLFQASFVGLTDYREGYYYSNDGTKDIAITSGKVAAPWLTKEADRNFYKLTESTTGVNAYLEDKFGFYHIAHDGDVYELASPHQNTQEILQDWAAGARWGLSDGKWLSAQFDWVCSWGELFRKQMVLVPKLDDELLATSDFAASFNLKHNSARNDPANSAYNGGAIAFTFHSSEVARLTSFSDTYNDAVTLVFTRDELVVYDGIAVDYSWQDLLQDENRIAWSNGTADAAHVELKVVKNKMDLKVTSLDCSTVYYEMTDKQLTYRDNPGYMYFSIANSSAALADIEITPIYRDDTAAPSDLVGGMKTISGFVAGNSYEYKLASDSNWTAVPAGTTTLTGLVGGTYEVRFAASKYCAASPAATVVVRDSNITPGDGTVKRFEADFAKLSDLADGKFDVNGYYVPQADDTAINDFMTERFGMFYNNTLRHAEERAYLGQSSNEFETDSMCPGGSYWRIGRDGILQRYDVHHFDGEMMRKAEVLTLKAPNGNYAKLKNFEATYTVTEDHNEGAITLSFRSADYNHVLCTDGYYADQTQLVFADQETVIIGVDQDGKHGITLGSGDEVHGRRENGPNGEIVNSLRYVDTEIAALASHDEYTVTVKALGDKLTVVIKAENGSVIWENTDAPFTLKRDDAGYMALSVTNAYKGIKGLVVTQLDDEGNPVDFGTGTRQPASHYDEENTTYYDFSDVAQMDDFDTYYLPEWSNLRKPLLTTTDTMYSNWYVKNGALHYKANEWYCDPATLANGVEIGGMQWQHTYEPMVPYTGNLGVAVLNVKSFENFILDMDFTGQNLWTQVGFGAANTADGVYHSNVNGGYNLALSWNGDNNTASTYLFYAEGNDTKQVSFSEQFAYKDRGTHHLQMIVSDLKLYVSLDGAEPIVYDIPEAYAGGYIYFTLNNPVAVLDNIRIVDLDEKAVVLTDCAAKAENQTIDRSKGDMLVLPTSLSYGTDRNGYEYPVLVTWENDEYRSYKEGSFDFRVGANRLHNLKLSDSFVGRMTVTNQIGNDFNTETTRKYYFDHPNDFLDFEAYYSELRHDRDFWRGTAEYQYGTTEYWSAYKGELVKAAAVTDKWQLGGDGTIGNAYYAVKGDSSPAERLQDVSTLVLTDYNLLNFRLEADVKMGDTWWFNYLLVGVQDPSAMYYALKTSDSSRADGSYTGFMTTDQTKKGGVWTFVEQEGYINVTGNLDGGLPERFTSEPDGYEFIKTYDKYAWHHVVVEVVDGIMMVRVDNSMTYYLVLDSNAIGGFVGIASHGNTSAFKNFQLTALDADGNEVPLDAAQSGFGAVDIYPTFVGWDPFKKLWDFDWTKKHFW